MSFFSIMVQGTTSDAGKSTLVTGLCRLLKQQGFNVAPFKPQNMALNSAVTADGKEIGRAQAVQAYAAGLEPHVDMNPILLKPNTDIGAQVIIHGQAIGNMNAVSYHEYKTVAKQAALDSFYRLQQQYDVVVTEGAGSPAEINLRDRDIANMGFAEAVDCPVIIIADIDKGGVFAHLVGTLALLSPSEQKRVVGFVINRFRGDISLLQSGLDWLEERTGKPVLGVLPYLMDFHLEAEDAVANTVTKDQQQTKLNVVIPILPRTSNHTDWDALRLHPDVNVTLVRAGDAIPPSDLVILPGSKSVQADLAFLKNYGWQDYLDRHLRYGGKLLGICGGYQMLGESLHDPDGLENEQPSSMAGFSYLPISTTLAKEKQLKLRQGVLPTLGNAPVKGYEIHAGVTTHHAPLTAFAQLENGTPDGAISPDGQVIGTYLHGLLDDADTLAALLTWAGAKDFTPFDYEALREREVARLAQSCAEHLDMEKLLTLCREFYHKGAD